MDNLVMKFANGLIGNHIKGDDFVDRLYYQITAAAFLTTAVGSGYMLYSGDPIECSLAGQSSTTKLGSIGTGTAGSTTGTQNEDGINAYCLAQPLQRPDSSGGDREGFVMDFGTAFFKWAPLVFVFQAFMFKLPNMLWTQLIASSTKELETVRNLVEEARALKDERERRLRMDKVVVYFETWVTGYKTYSKKWVQRLVAVFFCCGRHSGSYLSSLYISVKLLNFLVLILCACLLIGFFDGEFFRYGLSALSRIYSEGDWQDSANFPKMLICEYFVVKTASKVSASSVSKSQASVTSQQMQHAQCTMSINFFLEKVFLLEWFWFVFLGCVTIFNICVWVSKIKQPLSTYIFIRDYMETIDSLPAAKDGVTSFESEDSSSSEKEKSRRNDFVNDYLRNDGVFLLRLLEVNSGKAVVGELVVSLYKRYKKIHGFRTSNLNLESKCASGDDPESPSSKTVSKKPSNFWKKVALGKIIPKLKGQTGHSSNLDDFIPGVGDELGKNIKMPSSSTDIENTLDKKQSTSNTARPTSSSNNNQDKSGQNEDNGVVSGSAGPSKETETVDIISETDPQTTTSEESSADKMEEGLPPRDNDKGRKLPDILKKLPLHKIIPKIKKKLRIGSTSSQNYSLDDLAENIEKTPDTGPDSTDHLKDATFDSTLLGSDQSQEGKQQSSNNDLADSDTSEGNGGVVDTNVSDVDQVQQSSNNDLQNSDTPEGNGCVDDDDQSTHALPSIEGTSPDDIVGPVPTNARNSTSGLAHNGVGVPVEGLSPADKVRNSLGGLSADGDTHSKPEESQSLSDIVDFGTVF